MNITLTELWTKVNDPKYADTYSVSTTGRVRRDKEVGPNSTAGHILKPRLIKGYHSYRLYFRGKTKWKLAHRLVMEAFVPNPENKPQVNHKNGIKTDNRLENLEWVTRSENQLHMRRVLYPHMNNRGENGPGHKLSNKDVNEIRAWWKTGEVTQKALADKWGVCFQLISLIVNRKIWTHI